MSRDHQSPLEILTALVKTLEHHQELYRKLDKVRRIDENPTSTLDRLLQERAGIVDLLKALKAPTQPYDYDFKDNLVRVLRSLLAPHLAVANATEP
jgi:hypothetical protein